ncbi:MAG: DUF58 domain-containing protein [Ruminococcaceae bacterium]|nr:DUF58 domain-containing protein [Oscillospiraceae bacterium]
MVRSWAVYILSLLSSFIFFLCYKMWVSWICLIVILAIPFLSLVMCLLASRTMTFKTQCPASVLIGTPTNITVTTGGIASYFSFCKLKMTVTDRMAGTTKKHTIIINDKGVSQIPVNTKHCGCYSYDLTWLTVYDLFGLFFTKTNINKINEILVKPAPSMPGIMPDMYGFKAKNLRKSKLPSSEIYDIKEYQIGDPIRSIHWKMSAKKDALLVKEPLEEYGGHSRVILRLTDDRDEMDLHLGQIIFTSKFYIEHETNHKIRIIPPDQGELAFEIESETDLERAIAKILRMRLPKEGTHEKETPDGKNEPAVAQKEADSDAD